MLCYVMSSRCLDLLSLVLCAMLDSDIDIEIVRQSSLLFLFVNFYL